jgi:hypothetical protein
LIESTTVAVANYALWRVEAFNQLVRNFGDFLTSHADEITSADTTLARREELAAAAMTLSLIVHLDGIGEAWGHPGGSAGWYRALIEAVLRNLGDLEQIQRRARWQWLRPSSYLVIDALAVAGVVSVTASVAAGY